MWHRYRSQSRDGPCLANGSSIQSDADPSMRSPMSQPSSVTLNADLPLPILPPEIIELIVIHAARPLLPPDHAPYEDYFRARKAHWKCLGGVTSSTKYYRYLLVKRWFSVVVLREPSDWALVSDPTWMGGLKPSVGTIMASSNALISSPRNRTDTGVLASFDRLTRATLDCHNDFLRSRSNYPHHQLVKELPRSLKFLEILNAHGPDEHMIELVSRCCPGLTELRLGRCTMFNNRNCVWWKAHPAEHDAYMTDQGVEAYASAVGSLIENMPRLQTLHIGVYLTPIEAVWAHRVDHRRLRPTPNNMFHENLEGTRHHLHPAGLTPNGGDPELSINYQYPFLVKKEIWDAPCSECDRYFKAPAEDVEMHTACVLSARVWSLRTVSFASFTSPGRVGASSWEVRPKHSVDGYLLDGDHSSAILPLIDQDDSPIRFVEVDVGRLNGLSGTFQRQKTYIWDL